MKNLRFHIGNITGSALRRQLTAVAAVLLLGASLALRVAAQGTAFTYQGQLSSSGSPANGSYDITFTLLDGGTNGNLISGPLTNTAVEVTNGIFTATLDFGANFPGLDRWLKIGVRPHGNGSFTSLSPLQHFTPTPYAITAENLANVVELNSVGQFYSTVAGGEGNNSSGGWAFIGGGADNSSLGEYDVVSGGLDNSSISNGATVGGGYYNSSGNQFATVGGGWENSASGEYSTVGGGYQNTALGYAATVAGGDSDNANDSYATVGGGYGNTSSFGDTIAGGIANTATNYYSTVGGGYENDANGYGATVAGGFQNMSSADYATVSGGIQSYATAPGAFVGGGGTDGNLTSGNNATGNASTVDGGLGNTNTSNYGTLCGGAYNYCYVNGYETIIGGSHNYCSGDHATICGGGVNLAAGSYSFAAGSHAQAVDSGAFVWSDGSGTTYSTANNQFMARASGGFVFYTGSGTGGAQLAPGATAWSVLSDRNAKKNIQPADCRQLLDKLAGVPIDQWHYNWESNSGAPNIGPMAQDFKHAFFPGRDDKSISTLEFDGVELAAIQGLNQKINEKDTDIQQLKQQNGSLMNRLNELEHLVQSLAEKK